LPANDEQDRSLGGLKRNGGRGPLQWHSVSAEIQTAVIDRRYRKKGGPQVPSRLTFNF
jgi:hypothetical protein